MPGTTVNGDVGFTTGPAVAPAGTHPNYGSGAPYAAAGTDQGVALSALASQPCTFTFAPGAINLSTDTTHGPIGVYTPGVYCSTGAMDIGGALSLSGAGTYIFRPVGALTSTAGSIVSVVNGASACDVFWTPSSTTTLAATTTFLGNVISNSGITVGSTVNWTGRALAFGGTVTTDVDTISVPVCAAGYISGGTSNEGTINVVKTVINDNGGTKTASDFEMFVNGGLVKSGITYRFSSGLNGGYLVTETSDPKYTRTFSGDCDSTGRIFLNSGESKFCIIINDDIGTPVAAPPVPPLIDVVKVPSPLSLPSGPGQVSYSYTVRNIGTVPVSNLTLVGDTCSPINLTSGDLNNDAKLDLNEVWIFNCSTNLTETHTNTIVATGWANGISATDIASSTVIVGAPVIPPLIHITKVPSRLSLLAGGGLVTYTKKVTNPGTVPLNNVRVSDDKCGPVSYISGDANSDGRLDTSETWTYVCQSNLTKNTTNTATATGEANGITVRDFAIATVVVANVIPTLPNTGFMPDYANAISLISIMSALVLLLILARKKQLI